ncbi:hypothetical protein N9L20_03200 [Flavobacteriaceae bacterium]|nr:hypothetical protein [Flavobacteriaceae bacterium]
MKITSKLGLILITIASSLTLNAQRSIEINPFIGYTFSGTATGFTYAGTVVDFDMKDGMSYGAILNFGVGDLVQGELAYMRVDTRVVRYGAFTQPESFDVGMESYQIGGVKEFMVQENFLPYGKFTLGANRYFDKAGLYGSNWAFSMVFGAGVKYFISDRVGLKLYTNLNLPMEFNGIGLWFGSGGASGGASFYVPLVHWDLGGGLIFKLEQ